MPFLEQTSHAETFSLIQLANMPLTYEGATAGAFCPFNVAIPASVHVNCPLPEACLGRDARPINDLPIDYVNWGIHVQVEMIVSPEYDFAGYEGGRGPSS
jgi:hypothetical protein